MHGAEGASAALPVRALPVRALLAAMRPRQWSKNLLVLAAPVFAGLITHPDVLIQSAVAFVDFCVAASAVYLLNDVVDLGYDRVHPVKRLRPIAAGEVRPRTAVTTSIVLTVVALAVAVPLGWQFVLVIGAYCGFNLAYCLALKDEPVIDIAIIASSFLLRAVGGGVASSIELSEWFLLIAAFGSLFMAAGKRYAEVHLIGEGDGTTRRSLAGYSASYLRFVWSVAAGVLIMSYALWSFQIAEQGSGTVSWAALSMIPFVLAVLRYAVDVDAGRAGEPEEIVMRDHTLQILGTVWLVLIALAIYV
jgi:decaprenyl-phosphate phosphoribosyltransferase